MSTEDAKAYLSKREVPRLFECLMTGLMFHRPNDHIQYLIDSLEKVKIKGQADMTWNMFVEVRSAKTPLPPITPDNGRRPVSRGRVTPKVEEARPKSTPLPPIGSSSTGPNVPVVFIMGGPGSGKADQAEKLCEKHPGWININLGKMLREKMLNKSADGKWRAVKDLVVSGELAPEEITIKMLQKCFSNNTEANGFIIQGFPRDLKQAAKFEEMVTRVDAVFLLDCEEEKLTNIVLSRGQSTGRLDDSPSAIAKRMATFKEHTLPVLKQYDDLGKLYIVNGDQDSEATHDELSIIFETLLQNMENGRIPSPPVEGRRSTGRKLRKSATPPTSPAPVADKSISLQMPEVVFVPPPEIKVPDEGRKANLPQAPIIFLAGGPGSGKGTQCSLIMKRYPDIVHLSLGDILRKEISERGSSDEKWGMITKLLKEGEMAPRDVTEELLIKSMKEHPSARAYMVEGYPRDALQYEDFNRNIGGQSYTVLLDCEDQYLRERLILRGGSGTERIDDNIPAIENKLAFFARNTLPLLKAIEDEQKLIVVDGDRDEQEVFFDIVKCIDFSLYGTKLEEVTTETKTDCGDAEESAGGGEADDGDADADKDKEKAAIATTTPAAAEEEKKNEEGGDEAAPVVEDAVVVASASVPTGALVDNPSYTQELDALAEKADDKQEDKPSIEAGTEEQAESKTQETEGEKDAGEAPKTDEPQAADDGTQGQDGKVESGQATSEATTEKKDEEDTKGGEGGENTAEEEVKAEEEKKEEGEKGEASAE